MKKVLITGASGFIGGHLVKRLRNEGLEVSIFDETKHSLEKRDDLLKLLTGCDTIFHLAAINDPEDKNLFRVNVLGTIELLEAVKIRSPGARFVFPSSFAVYKTPKKGEKIAENFETSPRNKYGLSKLLAEEVIRFYANQGAVKAFILRMSNVYGPRDRAGSVVTNLFNSAKKGKKVTIHGGGGQTRDFVYVKEVIEAFYLAANFNGPDKFKTVNICSGKETSLKKLVSLVEEVIGKKIVVKFGPRNTSGGGYWQGKNLLAKKLFGWKQSLSLKDGLNLTWEKIQ